MYIADLSQYSQSCLNTAGYTILAVGWLDKSYPFSSGPTPPAFQKRLLEHCVRGVHVPMMGFHECQFCEKWNVGVWYGNKWVLTYNGEIWIPDGNIIYSAPVMIYHYVTEHEYRPPDVFIDAVMRCPLPYEEEYLAFARSIGSKMLDLARPN